MSDLSLTTVWLGILVAGLGACVVVHAMGLAATYVRDLLHIGASVWLLGWPHWHAPALPIAIVVGVFVGVVALPLVAGRLSLAARLVRSVTSDDEHWTGLVHYTASYALFTALGLIGQPLPAALGLVALSLGDGIGGAIGRRFGRHHFQAPGAKRKSLEGSAGVLVAASLGITLVGLILGQPLAPLTILVLGTVAALTEALAPRGSDNLMIPLAVWTTATLLT